MHKRSIWLWMAALSILVLAFSHFILQGYLMMRPCEKCVYVRFAVLVCAIASLIRFFTPSRMKALGLGVDALFLAGCAYGIANAVALLDAEARNTCSLDALGIEFPFGLPLHEWIPSLFAPKGICGESLPVVMDGQALDSLQSYLIGEYLQTGGWYLIPSLKLGSVAGCSLFLFIAMASAVVLIHLSSFRRNK